MAHIRKHARSPFWYVRRRDPDSGKWVEHSTGTADSRQAQRTADKYSAKERSASGVTSNPAFNAWVLPWIGSHYANKAPGSLRRYSGAWRALRLFLNAEGIIYPRQLKYAHGMAYIRWRMANPINGKGVGHNTALLELKFLAQIMAEAVRREFAETNPIAHLGIGRAPQKVKPELSDKEIKRLWQELSDAPEWAKTAFQIALHTGCRFSECEIPLDRIDFKIWTITVRDAKRREGDPRKYFTVPVDPPLRPLLLRLKRQGAEVTCRLSDDKNGRINYLFRKAGVDASFHSLRVTFVTRLHRAGVSMPEAMKLVNHSQQLVHRVYSRLTVEDVRAARARVRLPRLK